LKKVLIGILARIVVPIMILSGASIAFISCERSAPASGETKILVNIHQVAFSQPLQTEQGTILAPIRPIADLMYATTRWDTETRTVTVIYGNIGIAAAIDNSIMAVRNMTTGVIREVSLLVPPRIINGVEYFPIETIARELGATVTWDAATNTLRIVTP